MAEATNKQIPASLLPTLEHVDAMLLRGEYAELAYRMALWARTGDHAEFRAALNVARYDKAFEEWVFTNCGTGDAFDARVVAELTRLRQLV